MKAFAQTSDFPPKVVGGSGGGGTGRRNGSDNHSIVRVEPTDDLTVCITPSAGTWLSAQFLHDLLGSNAIPVSAHAN